MSTTATPAAPDATPAESSPASVSERSLESLSETERTHWRLTGEMPSTESTEPTPADTAPAAPDVQAVSTETSDTPASEPGKPPKKNAETRKAELNSEIQSLLEQRAALRTELDAMRRPAAPEPAPAASEPAGPRSLNETIQTPDLSRPPLTEEDFFVQYPDAKMGDFTRYVTRYELTSQEQARSFEQIRRQRVDTYVERMKKAGVTPGDTAFWSSVDPRIAQAATLDQLPPGAPVGAINVLAQEIAECESPKDMVLYLSEHREDLDRLLTLPNATAIARQFGRLEAKLTATASQPAPAGNPVSLAPPPPATLGSKPATPANEKADALASGDFARYREIVNAEEMRLRTA